MLHWSYWLVALEARLRKANGDAFQTFFSALMGRVHGDAFVPVRPHGNLGDGGVDGYFCSDDTVYQCYGALGGLVHDLSYVREKMKTDYQKALNSTKGMKRWRFTHNLTEGLPKPLLDTFEEIRQAGKRDGIEVTLFGFESFQELLAKLDNDNREALLGVRAMQEVDRVALPREINKLIGDIMGQYDGDASAALAAGPVPQDKLDLNEIPQHWRAVLTGFFVHAPIAEYCLATFGEHQASETIPAFLRARYLNLRNQGLPPASILQELKTELLGSLPGGPDSSREAAVLTLLASMFESCVVFEDKKYIPLEEPAQ